MTINNSNRPSDESTTNQGLLTYCEAARRLGCSERTVWELVRRGELPAVKYLRNVRIDPRDLDAFIANHKENANLSLT